MCCNLDHFQWEVLNEYLTNYKKKIFIIIRREERKISKKNTLFDILEIFFYHVLTYKCFEFVLYNKF